MDGQVFIANKHPRGITRAEKTGSGWKVEQLLQEANGGSAYDVRCFATDPNDANVVYAGTQGSGLLRSVDRGKTWEPAGLASMVVKSITVSKARAGFIVAGTKPPLVYASYDNAASWEELSAFQKIPSRPFWRSPAEPPGIAYVQSVAISPTDPDVIVAGIEAGAVVRTEDGGKTWPGHRRAAIRDCHSLIFHANDGRYAYEAGGSATGFSFSKDAGATWERQKPGLDRHYGWGVAADPEDPEVWYFSAAPGPLRAHSLKGVADAYIYRSMDDGPWEKLGGGLPQPLNFMPYALLTDPGAPGHLYAGCKMATSGTPQIGGIRREQLPVSVGDMNRAMIMLP